jgi:anti-sigma regulatory factor (Ser/Thr protein kinase)
MMGWSVTAGDPASASVAGIKPHISYQHEAYFYGSTSEFLEGTVPFVTQALQLDQPVMVALVKPRLEVLREALGEVRGPALFIDMGELGANPARIVPAWLAFVEAFGGAGRPIRGISEPQWPGRHPEEAVECQLQEGLLNLAIDPDVPLWVRCPYDVAQLDPALIEAARQSHPALVEGGQYRGSTSYGGLHHVNSVFRSPLPPAPAASSSGRGRLLFAGDNLNEVLAHVSLAAGRAGLDPDRAHALMLAVAELAANSVRHGGGGGELVTWVQPGALVCEIADAGRIGGPMIGRRAPRLSDEKGRGLWLANQLSDLIQIRSNRTGTVARVFAWLPEQSSTHFP